MSETLLKVPADTPSIVQTSCPVPVVMHWNTAEPPGHIVSDGDVSRAAGAGFGYLYIEISTPFKDLPSEVGA